MSAPPPRVMVLSCPELSVPGRGAAQLFEQVITTVTGFCPRVEAVEPGVCAFGARGPARYFGGETALADLIIAAVAESGVQARVGVADGLFAARLASAGASPAGAGPARADPAGGDPVLVIPPGRTAEFLAGQPVSSLADQGLADQDLIALLTRLGLRTLGDLATLPASDVASRFGAAGETLHRLSRGLGSRPLAVRPPAEDLSVAQEFNPPESLAEPVVFAAKALAEQLHAVLAARGLTCIRIQVRVICADGRESSRRWRHDGLLSEAAVADRVRWQLDGWRGPGPAAAADAGIPADAGIAELRLVPDQVVHATGHQLALWGETLVSDRVARAAMRVQALLGHEAVLRPVLGGGRDVSEQVTHVPFGEKMLPRLTPDAPWPGQIMGAAPGVVYPFARTADVTDEAGDAITITGRCLLSGTPSWLAADGQPPLRITGWAGPWPLSERWWDPAAARRRARFQLLTGDGRAWLAAVQDGRWLIEAGYWLWAGTTRRSPGASCGGGWPGAPRTRRPRGSPPSRTRHAGPGLPRALKTPSRGPSCTAIPPSASWTGRPRPVSWWPRQPGSGSRRSPSPTTTGCTASRRREAPRSGDPAGHRVRRRAQPGPAVRADRRARPGRPSPARPGPRRGGLPKAVRRDQRRPAGRPGEGPPGLRRGRAGRRAWRSLGGPDRVP